jgi:cytochrome c oxidase accessory protein FixG
MSSLPQPTPNGPELLTPEDRVLSTLNADGSRRWLDPKPVEGVHRSRRKVLAWFLIVLFMVLPHLYWGGRQLFFVNVAGGEFTLFGVTFLRTDTLLLALAAITLAVSVFLVTALFGRVWCGWACPQTVYLEFLFRPIGRLFDGKGRKGVRGVVSHLPGGLRAFLRWGLVAVICFHLANTFLAYFVGSRTVFEWSLQGPWHHPAGFVFVVIITGAMIFNFGFFREQLCFIACPYGRFQSVLLDKQSLIVGYDAKRGEPRANPRARKRPRRQKAGSPNPDIALPIVETAATPTPDEQAFGDCVACDRCVAVCPTGIDIREGLQMECIHCARCIDACNEVMAKVGKELGLIRYSSQSVLSGAKARFFRPRVIVYPLILAIVSSLLIGLSATHADADIRFIRGKGQPFYTLPTGEISNQIRLRITNRTREPRVYTVEPAMDGFRIETEGMTESLAPGETDSINLVLIAQPGALVGGEGSLRVPLTVRDDAGFETTQTAKFLSPLNLTKALEAAAASRDAVDQSEPSEPEQPAPTEDPQP